MHCHGNEIEWIAVSDRVIVTLTFFADAQQSVFNQPALQIVTGLVLYDTRIKTILV
jgi:hypothetical protein